MTAYDVQMLVQDPISAFPKTVFRRVEAETPTKARNLARRLYERNCAPIRVERILSVEEVRGDRTEGRTVSNALDTLRRHLAHGVNVETGKPILLECESTRALARVEAVIEAARGIDPEFMGHEALAPLRAALAALDEGGET